MFQSSKERVLATDRPICDKCVNNDNCKCKP